MAVGEKRDVVRDIMNDCHGCSGQTLSEKMGCMQGEKLLQHEDQVSGYTHRVQRSNHRMEETKCIVTRERRGAQQ